MKALLGICAVLLAVSILLGCGVAALEEEAVETREVKESEQPSATQAIDMAFIVTTIKLADSDGRQLNDDEYDSINAYLDAHQDSSDFAVTEHRALFLYYYGYRDGYYDRAEFEEALADIEE